MKRNHARALAGAVLILAGLTGCAGAPAGDGGDAATPDPSGGAATDAMPPSELVGLWQVDAAGEESDARLQVGSRWGIGELTLWRDCGPLYGMWVASGHDLLLDLHAFGQGCDTQLPHWLGEVTGYARASSAVVLLDASDEVIATLTPDTSEIDEYDADHGQGPARPVLGADEAVALDESAAPPDGIEPAAVEDLLGRWVPAVAAADDAEVVLDPSGSWRGSDGCNSTGGRWLAGGDGRLLVTSGVMTAMACEGMYLIDLGSARWAEVDGDRLVLYDAAGEVVDEAVRTR